MAHILVAGNVNLDRVWSLDAPVRPGARLAYHARTLRCGGGGFNTGAALLALGHRVSLATTLGQDAAGRACRDALASLGFDLAHVAVVPRRTRTLEILVDPAGERTILAPASTEAHRVAALPELPADALYLNVRRLDPRALAPVPPATPIISQLPLEAGEVRPATVLIGSAADGGLATDGAAREPPDLFAAARRISGNRLAALVLTDGAGPVRLIEPTGGTRVAVPPCPAPADTTGSGDVFAAGFLDGWLRGLPAVEAVGRGNEVAARFLLDRAAFGGAVPLALDPEDLTATA